MREPTPGADVTKPEHPDGRDALNDLQYQHGECRRVDDLPTGRRYHLCVGGLLLVITADLVIRGSAVGMHYDEAYGKTTQVEPGEAFEYLHGTYEPEKEHFCIGCSTAFEPDEGKQCSCPVGRESRILEWPTVPTRQPRMVVNGMAVVRPSTAPEEKYPHTERLNQ